MQADDVEQVHRLLVRDVEDLHQVDGAMGQHILSGRQVGGRDGGGNQGVENRARQRALRLQGEGIRVTDVRRCFWQTAVCRDAALPLTIASRGCYRMDQKGSRRQVAA